MHRFFALALVGGALAAAPESPQFEVVSIRPAVSLGPIFADQITTAMAVSGRLSGGPGTSDPERISAARITLRALVAAAYGVRADLISGPGWLDSERYQIAAKVPAGTTAEQSTMMLQRMLQERFKLVLHKEKKQTPAWDLVVAKEGPRLKATVNPSLKPEVNVDFRDGLLHQSLRGYWMSKADASDTGGRLDMMISMYISRLAGFRSTDLVTDKTGLTGQYDFTLEVQSPELPERFDPGLPDIFSAVQKLGLKLEERKVPADAIVIDSAERSPAEN
jgi:uncharacterized protein (TIGR03435 family)